MSLQIRTVTESIADIQIAGVNIKSLQELKEGFDAYDCPLLAPLPNGFVSGVTVTPAAFGSGEGRKLDVSYTLTYRYFHAPAGTGDITETWAAMIDNIGKILDAIMVNDAITGLVDLSMNALEGDGVVSDGSNNMYHGMDISFRVLEFVN